MALFERPRRFGPLSPLVCDPYEGPAFLDSLEECVCGTSKHLHRVFPGRQTLERTVRTMLIISPSPGNDPLLGVLDRLERMCVQACLREPAVEEQNLRRSGLIVPQNSPSSRWRGFGLRHCFPPNGYPKQYDRCGFSGT